MDVDQLHEMSAAFMNGCVLGAAAELGVFTVIGEQSVDALALADRLNCDGRAMRTLLDALASLGLLDKRAELYAVPDDLRPLLDENRPGNVLPMVFHRMNMLRRWSRLAWVVRSGEPAAAEPSIRGAEADRAAFVAAMHAFSGPTADALVARLGPPKFTHLLDVGGASATWTLAFLRAAPGATATLFDLPDAIGQAERRLAGTEFADRVTLVAGDFYEDDLPGGADFAWVSAIAHQHSREDTRRLLAKVHAALAPGGRVAIRDVVMEPSRSEPRAGALFAVNMLVATATGGTFTLAEFSEDLLAAGFVEPTLAVKDEAMNSVVTATRP
ncbi:MAG: methyltransferase domain-containing protein [Pirellulales bacterium]|nr:methyltransferase domain-containing protein [Pirellulales bacterium]